MAEEELKITLTLHDKLTTPLKGAREGLKLLAHDLSGLRTKLRTAGAGLRTFALRLLNGKTRAGGAARAVYRLAVATRNLGRAAVQTGRFVGGGLLRALGGLAKLAGGVVLGGIGALTAGAFGLAGAMGAMREAMEGSTESAGGAGKAAEDAGERVGGLARGVSRAADESERAAGKIRAVFGAFGDVGAGFIQQQGRILDETTRTAEQATRTAESAAESAAGATDALEETQAALGETTAAGTRFGQAVNRIGAAWQKAKTQVLQAIAVAITPALEKLADLMESPAFRQFVTLLAEDMAKAAAALADWFMDNVIPAITEFMEQVNEAGGPIEWLKGKFEELKTTALMLLGIIVGKLLEWSIALSDFFSGIVDGARGMVGEALDAIDGFLSALWDGVTGLANGLGSVLEGAASVVKGVLNGLIDDVEGAVNRAIDALNGLLRGYNDLVEGLGLGDGVDLIPHISIPHLATGGIVTEPTVALLGERGPEAVVPLEGGTYFGDVHITVNMQGGADGETGWAIGQSIVDAMRAQGLLVPGVL